MSHCKDSMKYSYSIADLLLIFLQVGRAAYAPPLAHACFRLIKCVLFLSSQLNPGNQSPKAPSLPRRPGSKNHRPTRLLMPNPPERSWIYWAWLPWWISTTFPTMRWTVWHLGGLAGNTHRKQRKRGREQKRKKINIFHCSEVEPFLFYFFFFTLF